MTRSKVTGLIHEFAEDFDSNLALAKMKSGGNWPRPDYIPADVDLKAFSSLVDGSAKPSRADVLNLLNETKP